MDYYITVFDTVKEHELDVNKLQEAPILYIRGFLPGRMSFVVRGGGQFKATWQSESFYTRRGEMDGSSHWALKNQDHFQMFFTCSETDMDKYSVPTHYLPSWADTDIFDNWEPPEIFDRLGFFGGIQGREDFLNKDRNGIIERFQTSIDKNDAKEMTIDLAKSICKYQMLVSPPGRCFTGMCGRAWEIMACRRMAFVYYNEDTMFKTARYFTDGNDLVYFRDMDELVKKFKYYLPRMDDQYRIATNGYNKVRRFHNADIRVKYIVECMEDEYKEWKKYQDSIKGPLSEAYIEL